MNFAASSTVPLPASAEIAMRQAQASPQLKGQLAQKAKEFEGMFYSQMLAPMFDSMETDPVFGGGQGEKMFRSLLTEQYGKLMAEGQGNSPLSTQVRDMMLKIQEQQAKR